MKKMHLPRYNKTRKDNITNKKLFMCFEKNLFYILSKVKLA